MQDRIPARSNQPSSHVDTEDLHLRNYDAVESHTLWVRVVGDDVEFERTYSLAPEGTASESDVVPPGEYDVEVELDGLRRWVDRCRIDDRPEHGLLVETGNGTVSITEGVVR